MKRSLFLVLALFSISSYSVADTTYTLTAQTITKFTAYSQTLYFETNGFSESTCDDESIIFPFDSAAGAQVFSILKDAAINDSTIKTVQYFWDSSEENCYLRFIELY